MPEHLTQLSLVSSPVLVPVLVHFLNKTIGIHRSMCPSYVVNSAAGFNRCTSKLQERIASNVSFLCGKINKGKAPKDVTEALKDIKDLLAFHQNVSMAMGTALQHLADSLFVHLANLILLRRDSYLEFVKPGVKPDTWNLLRNAPMFGYGLFPDSVLNTAEQDINKHESAGVAPGPGPRTPQRSNWRGNFRYRPYDKRDSHRRILILIVSVMV